jgi:hypothetical protein
MTAINTTLWHGSDGNEQVCDTNNPLIAAYRCTTAQQPTLLFALGAEAGACCRLVAMLAALAARLAGRGDVAVGAAEVALEAGAGRRLVTCAQQAAAA